MTPDASPTTTLPYADSPNWLGVSFSTTPDGCEITVPGIHPSDKSLLSNIGGEIGAYGLGAALFMGLFQWWLGLLTAAAAVAFAGASVVLDRYIHRNPPRTTITLSGESLVILIPSRDERWEAARKSVYEVKMESAEGALVVRARERELFCEIVHPDRNVTECVARMLCQQFFPDAPSPAPNSCALKS